MRGLWGEVSEERRRTGLSAQGLDHMNGKAGGLRCLSLVLLVTGVMLVTEPAAAKSCISQVIVKEYALAPDFYVWERVTKSKRKRQWVVRSGSSVAKVFGEFRSSRGVLRYFYKYARYVEEALLNAVKWKFCNRGEGQGVAVEMVFIRLPFFANSRAEQELIRKKLKGVKGPYVDITVDEKHKKVKAVFIWNPRRMWRDMLIYRGEGWYFKKEEEQIIPYLLSDMIKCYKIICKNAILSSKKVVPDDIYAFYMLIKASSLPRLPLFDFFEYRVYLIIKEGVDGYVISSLIDINHILEKNKKVSGKFYGDVISVYRFAMLRSLYSLSY